MVTILTVMFPMNAFAAKHNKNFDGTYTNLGNKMSFIDISKNECILYIAYSPVEKCYIKAVVTSFAIDSEKFTATAKQYLICDEDGKTIRRIQTRPTVLQGKVIMTSKYIDIIIGNFVYEKKR